MKLLSCIAALVALLASVSFGRAAENEVIHGADCFDFIYRVRLPEITGDAHLWIPLAHTGPFQSVKVKRISAPFKWRQVSDRAGVNQILVMSPTAADSGKTCEIEYTVRRLEKAAYHDSADPAPFLRPNRLVPRTDTFQSIAEGVVSGKSSAMERGRALYDHVLARMKYEKTGTGWGRGDAVYACDSRTGNCTDFHAYFIALARAAGIPARFAIGATIPASRSDGAIAGYHCWAEFFADGRWVPIDISEASKTPQLADYYFGHHPANRFELSEGRDIEIDPPPASSPVNFLVYPLLEVGGQAVKADAEFLFHRLPN